MSKSDSSPEKSGIHAASCGRTSVSVLAFTSGSPVLSCMSAPLTGFAAQQSFDARAFVLEALFRSDDTLHGHHDRASFRSVKRGR